MMCHTTNIVGFDIFKWVKSFEPLTIELKNSIVKRTVERIGVFDVVGFKLLCHKGYNVEPFFLDNGFPFHTADVGFLFVAVVSSIKQHFVVPSFTYNKVVLDKGCAIFGVSNHIANVIAKWFGG